MCGKFRYFAIAVLVVLSAGCGKGKPDLIPTQRLDPGREEEITGAIREVNHAKLREIGKPAVPLILQRVLEIADSKSLSKDVRVSSDACNLIADLAHIGDRRATPALKHLLADKKYRTFRPTVAAAMGMMGDASAVDVLWKVFEEEKGYLAQGRKKGPDMGWGLAGNFTYQVLLEVGVALRRLGETVDDIPLDRSTRIKYEQFRR